MGSLQSFRELPGLCWDFQRASHAKASALGPGTILSKGLGIGEEVQDLTLRVYKVVFLMT